MNEYLIKITCYQLYNFAVNVFGSQTKPTFENLGTFSKWEFAQRAQNAQSAYSGFWPILAQISFVFGGHFFPLGID